MLVTARVLLSVAIVSSLLTSRTDAAPSMQLPSTDRAVTQNGAAVLEIPIPAPPGTAGFQPDLRLRYSSQGGDGPFGIGWSLNLSEIRRSNRNGTPTYGLGDEFELDGMPLIRRGLTNRFHTLSDNFQKIERTVGSSSTITSWMVTSPNGVKAIYRDRLPVAQTSRWLLSELENPDGLRICFLYEDDEESGSVVYKYLDSVTYTHDAACDSAGGTIGATKKIKFVYDDRTDEVLSYTGGFQSLLRQRADSIEVSIGGELKRKVSLAYSSGDDYSTKRTRLTRATLTSCKTPTDCDSLPDADFVLTDPDELEQSVYPSESTLDFPERIEEPQGANKSRDLGWRTGDLDGDGRPELARAFLDENGTPIHKVYRWTETGFQEAEPWSDALAGVVYLSLDTKVIRNGSDISAVQTPLVAQRIYFAEHRDWRDPIASDSGSKTFRAPVNARLVDVNGDRRADIVLSHYAVSAHFNCASNCTDVEQKISRVLLNNGVTWEADEDLSASLPAFESFWLRENASQPTGGAKCIPLGSDTCAARLAVVSAATNLADVTGDGRLDVLQRLTGSCAAGGDNGGLLKGAWVQRLDGWEYVTELYPPEEQSRIFEPFGCVDAGVRYADVNGDGMADVVRGATANAAETVVSAKVYLSRGENCIGCAAESSSWVVAPARYDPPTIFLKQQDGLVPNLIFFLDVNADGLVDMVRAVEGSLDAWVQDRTSPNGSIWRPDDRFKPAIGIQPQKEDEYVTRVKTKGVIVADFDGNGMVDYLKNWGGGGGAVESRYAVDLFSDRLRTVTNGEGARISYSYESLVAQRDPELQGAALVYSVGNGEGSPAPFSASNPRDQFWPSTPVVSRMDVFASNGASPYIFTYRYAGSAWDRIWRIPFGPSLVEVTRPGESASTHSVETRNYRQGHGLLGRVARSVLEAPDGAVRQVEQEWSTVPGADANGSWPGASFGRLLLREAASWDAQGIAGAVQTEVLDYQGCNSKFNFACTIQTHRPSGDSLRTRVPVNLESDWILGLVGTETIHEGVTAQGNLRRSTTSTFVDSGAGGIGKLETRSRSIVPSLVDGHQMAVESWSYDGYGNVIAYEDPLDRVTAFAYDGSETNCAGGGSSAFALLTQIVDPLGGVECISRDPSTGAETQIERFNNDLVILTLDHHSRVRETEYKPEGGTQETLETVDFYDGEGAYAIRTRPVGNGTQIQTATVFDGLGRPVLETGPGDIGGFSGTAREFDFAGRTTTETLPRECADVLCSSFGGAPAPTIERTFDGLGRLKEMVDRGSVRSFFYTGGARAFPPGLSVAGTGSELDVVTIQDAVGKVTRQLRDGDRALWIDECNSGSAGSCIGPSSTYVTYEVTGEARGIYDSGAAPGTSTRNRTFYVYDTLGQVREIHDPDGSDNDDGQSGNDLGDAVRRLNYDRSGNLRTVQNVRDQATGRVTTYVYDPLDRLKRIHRGTYVSNPDPNTAEARIRYDDEPAQPGWSPAPPAATPTRGRMRVIGPGYAYDYKYDSFGRLSEERMTAGTAPQMISRFAWDLLGRLVKLQYPVASTNVSYRYAGANLVNVCNSTDSAPPYSTTCSGANPFWLSNIEYDEIGRPERLPYGGGELHHEYRPHDHRLKKTWFQAAGTTPLNLAHTYDGVGNLASVADTSAPGQGSGDVSLSATYAYDSRHRLQSWSRSGTVMGEFDYDSIGNLIGRALHTSIASQQTQHFDDPALSAHALAAITPPEGVRSAPFQYDRDGNRKHDPVAGRYYTYDDDNRLVRVGTSQDGDEIAHHYYDLDGRRIRSELRAENGQKQTHIYAGDHFEWNQTTQESATFVHALGQLIGTRYLDTTNLRTAETAPLGIAIPLPSAAVVFAVAGCGLLILLGELGALAALRRRPIAGGISLVVTAGLLVLPASATPPPPSGTGETKRFYVNNALGSTVLVVDTAGNVVARRGFEPYGRLDEPWTTEDTEQRFAIQRLEASSGLYDFRARWYDSATGSFVSVDPVIASLTDPQQHNMYAYARGNPVNLVDPTGESSCFSEFSLQAPDGSSHTRVSSCGGSIFLGGDYGISVAGQGGGFASITDRSGVLGSVLANRPNYQPAGSTGPPFQLGAGGTIQLQTKLGQGGLSSQGSVQQINGSTAPLESLFVLGDESPNAGLFETLAPQAPVLTDLMRTADGLKDTVVGGSVVAGGVVGLTAGNVQLAAVSPILVFATGSTESTVRAFGSLNRSSLAAIQQGSRFTMAGLQRVGSGLTLDYSLSLVGLHGIPLPSHH